MLNMPLRGADTGCRAQWEGKQLHSQELVASETLGSPASYLIPQKTPNHICPVGHCTLCPFSAVQAGSPSPTRAAKLNCLPQRAQRLDKPNVTAQTSKPRAYLRGGRQEMGHHVRGKVSNPGSDSRQLLVTTRMHSLWMKQDPQVAARMGSAGAPQGPPFPHPYHGHVSDSTCLTG